MTNLHPVAFNETINFHIMHPQGWEGKVQLKPSPLPGDQNPPTVLFSLHNVTAVQFSLLQFGFSFADDTQMHILSRLTF